MEIPPTGGRDCREKQKYRQNVSWGNARVCLLRTACWELHLLFSGGSLTSWPLGTLGSQLQGCVPIGSLGNSRHPWLRPAGVRSSVWVFGAAFFGLFSALSFGNRQRLRKTLQEFFRKSSPFFFSSRLKLEGVTICVKLGQDFPNFPSGEKIIYRRTRLNSQCMVRHLLEVLYFALTMRNFAFYFYDIVFWKMFKPSVKLVHPFR